MCGFGNFVLVDDISGIGKDLEEGESSGPGDKIYSPLTARRQSPTPIDAP